MARLCKDPRDDGGADAVLLRLEERRGWRCARKARRRVEHARELIGQAGDGAGGAARQRIGRDARDVRDAEALLFDRAPRARRFAAASDGGVASGVGKDGRQVLRSADSTECRSRKWQTGLRRAQVTWPRSLNKRGCA